MLQVVRTSVGTMVELALQTGTHFAVDSSGNRVTEVESAMGAPHQRTAILRHDNRLSDRAPHRQGCTGERTDVCLQAVAPLLGRRQSVLSTYQRSVVPEVRSYPGGSPSDF